MESGIEFNLGEFLASCKVSSQQAYENLKNILTQLEDPRSQMQARLHLHEIEEAISFENLGEESMALYHFSIDKLTISDQENNPTTFSLLQLPSIFTPEDWSFTFFEGLMNYPREEFTQRSIVELGCGNGWISIALAHRCSPALIVGLDINPRAIVCSKINLYLNAVSEHGQIKYDSKGKSLLDKVQFFVSDLLDHCLQNKMSFDKIIGCIPQVLSLEVPFKNESVSENLSDEALVAMSNYAPKQNLSEDQFGLGLIARAVEESLFVLKSGGKIIFNLGGRPSEQVLKHLFTRRGFVTRNIGHTKIEQAADTDISALVSIELQSPHRFEFFLSPFAKESISARTAFAVNKAGGKIYHALHVLEAEIKDVQKMRKIFELIHMPCYANVLPALDLSASDFSLTLEKTSFLSRLAEKLKSRASFPYEDTRGETSFRRRIAEFFRTYWRAPLSAKNILVAPCLDEIVKNYVRIFDVKTALVDVSLSRSMPSLYIQNGGEESAQFVALNVIECPKYSQGICQLIEMLKPQLIVCRLQEDEMRNQDSILRLIDTAHQMNAHLMFDFSEHFVLSKQQKINGLMEYLSEYALSPHVSIVCDLIHNKIYPDLRVTFFITENAKLLNVLESAAELTYSRTPIVTQEYYNTILFDLLNVRIKNNTKNTAVRKLFNGSELSIENNLKISKAAHSAFCPGDIEDEELEITSHTVRLDYGENSLPAPVQIKAILMESFALKNIPENETQVEEEIAKALEEKYNSQFFSQNIAVGNGVSALFATVADYCARQNITLIFPTGVYGYFVAAAKFFGVPILNIKTTVENGFKFKAEDLNLFFEKNKNKKFALFINTPVANPTGQIYTQLEIQEIFNVCEVAQCLIILDTIFAGLEYEEYSQKARLKLPQTENYILLGGISKEYAAAGLRFGYAYTPHAQILHSLKEGNSQKIPLTLKYAMKKLFALSSCKDKNLIEHQRRQRKILQQRGEALSSLLAHCGWQPLTPQGGLFLIASPSGLVGKFITLGDQKIEITFENVHAVLFKSTGLLVNSAAWCGIPHYCRFVISVSQEEFEAACEKLKEFYKLAN